MRLWVSTTTATTTTTTSISFKCCLWANVAFWIASSINIWVDYLAQQQTSSSSSSSSFRLQRRYKLQPKIFLTRQEQFDIFLVAVMNMILIAPFICCPMFELIWNSLYPPGIRLEETDSFQWTRELMKLPIDMLINECTFYTAHRLLHTVPFLYQNIHKQHHRFKAPNAMAATYAHPLEFIFGNVLCIALGPIVTNAHPYTAYFWFTAALLSTCKGHSGYAIANAKTHDDHHRHTNYNYGVLHIADYIMGTTLPPTSKCTANTKPPPQPIHNVPQKKTD